MAKGNRRLRSVVEGAVEASKEARRAAAAEKIRSAVSTAPPPQPTPPPPAAPAKPKRTRPKPTATTVETDTKLEATAEQRVPPSEPAPQTEGNPPQQMTAESAQRLRDTMLQSGRPKKRSSSKPQPAKPQQQKPVGTSGFAPVRGPGALLGRLLKETYRQAPNLAANAIAIPAFTAAGASGIYLGTAGTVAAIRGIQKLLGPSQAEERTQQPASPPANTQPDQLPAPQNDYRSGFQRAIDQRRKPRASDSGSDVIRRLSQMRGMA